MIPSMTPPIAPTMAEIAAAGIARHEIPPVGIRPARQETTHRHGVPAPDPGTHDRSEHEGAGRDRLVTHGLPSDPSETGSA